MSGKKRMAAFALVMAAAAAVGLQCALDRKSSAVLEFPQGSKPAIVPTIRFSHAKHAAAEIGCADCHSSGKEISIPRERGTRGCADCHEDAVGSRDKPSAACMTCHVSKDMKTNWPQSQRFKGLVFSHEKHVGGKCLDCHKGQDKAEGPASRPPCDMDSCMACHVTKKPLSCKGCHSDLATLKPLSHSAINWAPAHGPFAGNDGKAGSRNDCTACHGEDSCRKCHAEKKPASHGKLWTGAPHGSEARDAPGRCETCHGRSFCDACHAQNPPRDHDNHFRQAGHGVMLTSDRDRCRACHAVDFCTRCHSTTSPRSHTIGWNNPTNRHCLECHWPPGSGPSSCSLCHRTLPGHANQKPRTPAHATRSTSCGVCHSGAHISGSDSCIECHP